VKNHDFTPKNLIFSDCGGRGRDRMVVEFTNIRYSTIVYYYYYTVLLYSMNAEKRPSSEYECGKRNLVHLSTDVVSSNLDQGEVYKIM
jgi:hypothetical protein